MKTSKPSFANTWKIAEAASGHCYKSHTWPFGQKEVQLREFASTLHVKPLSGPGNLPRTSLMSILSLAPLSSPTATGEAPCGAHVFEGFFGLENGPVKSDKSQEKTLFGKEMPEDASCHPKPTSYPQTRQDTVVRVFPMESSN